MKNDLNNSKKIFIDFLITSGNISLSTNGIQSSFVFFLLKCLSYSPIYVCLFSILLANVTTEPNQDLLMMIENIARGNKNKHTDNAELMK